MSHKNNLQLVNLDGMDLNLTPLERQLIARLLLFQYIIRLPKSRMAGTKNKIVAVPVNEQDVKHTLESLPRTPNEAGIIPVQLKRKVEYKNCHRDEYIDKGKLFKAIDTLITQGHPYYAGVDLLEFRNKLQDMKLQDEADSSDESISINGNDLIVAVSYTHLTLPTKA